MTRHLYLWDYLNVARSCIAYNILDIFLCVIATVYIHSLPTYKAAWIRNIRAVIPVPPLRPVRFCSISGFVCQSRIFLHLHAPSTTISEVPVEAVEFEISHRINLFLQKVLCPEVARAVDHQTTISKTWRIFHFYTSNLAILFELANGLQTIEQTRWGQCLNGDTLWCNLQLITLQTNAVHCLRCLLGCSLANQAENALLRRVLCVC